jgi:dipeptidyl-peptidase-4
MTIPMMSKHPHFLILALSFVASGQEFARAQDRMHPEPPEFFEAQQGPRSRVFKDRIEPHWFKSNPDLDPLDRFWYRNDLADGKREFVVVDPQKAEKKSAFDHDKLAAALAKKIEKEVKADKLPFDSITIIPEGVCFTLESQTWLYDPKNEALEKSDRKVEPALVDAARAIIQRGRNPRQNSARVENSPDGNWRVAVKDHNLVLSKKNGKHEWPVTTDGTTEDTYESGVFWSPDSSRFVALRTAKEQEHTVYFVQSSPKTQVQPRLQKHQYLKPGDKIATTKPHLFNVETKEEIVLKDDLFNNPWNVQGFRWDADSSRFLFVYNQRGHQALRLIAVDAKSGAATALVNEESKTFIDYSNKVYLWFLDKSGDLLWMSERSGWNHLYRIDAKTGAVKNAVTSGEWVVRGVDRVDEEAGTVEFRLSGFHAGQDPYHVHVARVKTDGSNLTVLTDGDGTHTIQYSPDRKYMIDTFSRVDLPPFHELRKVEDGKLVVVLEKADDSAFEASGGKSPERFVAKGRDGKTDIYGLIVRPKNFDAKKKYPVIEQIYAGPHGAHVPKAFGGGRNLQGLADLGFILVEIDGMGTNWRSKAFHDVCWKNLKDAGFPDRILWMKVAAEKYPEFDLSRVGIYGGSAGGQNALAALLFHGDFYKAAVADCGCHDNRMDKIWWNEAWMGWPVDKSYEDSSNVVNASKMQGKLMLTVGETDHNVDPASTMQVADALIKANKDFELIIFPGADHGAGSSAYGRRRMREFFSKHLLKEENTTKPTSPVAGGGR